MNIHYSGLPETLTPYFPLGNTPPVCLTQDLPPENNADILLLGCGGARNVLFTCFADDKRKLDFTCCDIEPMIHARNVLLYTLLMDDKSNKHIELIWNIYHHWKIDSNSVELLESHIHKLLEVSDSITHWHNSVYGSTIRFCDEQSLSSVRSFWEGFTTRNLSPSAKKVRFQKLQAVIDRAKENHRLYKEGPDLTGYQSLFPTNINPDEAHLHLCEVAKQWWDFGALSSANSPILEPTHLNPVFLYSPNYKHTVEEGTSPLGSIPLCTAYISINKSSPFCQEKEGRSSTQHLVNCAKSHFFQWAPAFRKAVKNESVIRIFSGHAYSFCFTLRNCQLTGSTSMNLACHYWTSSPLILHNGNYGSGSDAAPLSFDIIDTSNLADYFGPLNLISLTSSLLKHNVSSCLYTQLMAMFDASLQERLTNLFGVDVRSMSFLLGLVMPDLFTNATNTIEEYPNIYKVTENDFDPNPAESGLTVISRLRWRRFGKPGNLSSVQVDAKELAEFLIQVHNAMFQIGPRFSVFESHKLTKQDVLKQELRPYNRASFAFLLSILKATLITDWDRCLKEIYRGIAIDEVSELLKDNFLEDLFLNLHIFGVDSSHFTKPNPASMHSTILTSVFPKCENLPDQLCVTVRIAKKHLKVIYGMPSCQGIICSFEGVDSHGKHWHRSFSSIQIAFKESDEQTQEDSSNPFKVDIETVETCVISEVFASVFVPTSMLISMLLQSEQFVPMVKIKFKFSPMVYNSYRLLLGQDLCLFRTKITSADVSITQFMPGMSGLPTFTMPKNQLASNLTVARFSDDFQNSKINSLIRRITLKSETDKALLANKSTDVKVTFLSPFAAIANIGGSLKFKLEFPVPVSIAKHKIRIARKSSYIEIESCFLDPLKEYVPSFLFPCSLIQTPHDIAPVPWTSVRVNLDKMPSLKLHTGQELTWLYDYLGQMFSRREYMNFLSNTYDSRVNIKESLSIFFMAYSGYFESKENFLILQGMDQTVKALILPSCLRLDLASYTVVLDSALIPVTRTVMNDPVVFRFLKKLENHGPYMRGRFGVNNDSNRAWKAMMPALVERCRTWSHTSGCDYKKIGQVPLPKGLDGDDESPICSCGIGKFPEDYLKDQIKEFPALNFILRRYATRVAISPFFAVTYVEDCDIADLLNEMCARCGSNERKNALANQKSLLKCSRCKEVQYCSIDCQKADWKKHKPLCKPVNKGQKS